MHPGIFANKRNFVLVCMMVTFKITGEYIQLIQLLKVLNWVEHGGEAQAVVMTGMVKYNGKTDFRKRLKVRPGDTVEFRGKQVCIV
ncbi:ribosome-associated protein [Parapedobacter luteus]|uniref:Ribosome-associated protein n=2 Tax=Parapedobacter luteus TaxID=623280 RepID=A0A1T5E3J9_9SPHI|nr:ribosome-associated protein [Parapedobacter luteus]